tara:strand:- start:1854 stop:2456 length:603 start_codon:yes stop_codon:yes gene_type:complete
MAGYFAQFVKMLAETDSIYTSSIQAESMPKIGPMIAASAQLGLGYAERLLKDVPADRFARFAQVGDTTIESNHPAFIYGHLGLYASRVIAELGCDASDYNPSAEYDKLFSKDAVCVDDPDGSIYPSMEDVTSHLFTNYQAAIAALEQADDSIFEQQNPNEAMRAKFATVGAMHAFYVGGHFMLHMGQMSAWRRMAGFGPA